MTTPDENMKRAMVNAICKGMAGKFSVRLAELGGPAKGSEQGRKAWFDAFRMFAGSNKITAESAPTDLQEYIEKTASFYISRGAAQFTEAADRQANGTAKTPNAPSIVKPTPQTVVETPTISDAEIDARLKEFATDASSRCGCVHDMYVKFFSDSVDRYVYGKPERLQARIIERARKSDYATPEEISKSEEEGMANGYCRHGLPSGCCPLGCDDLEM